MTTGVVKDSTQYPVLRNLQFSPIKQEDDQLIVLWDPSGLSHEKLVLPLNLFFIVQHFDGEHSLPEIGALYLKRFGEFLLPSKVEQLVADLDQKLFLEGPRAETARQQAQIDYRQRPSRPAVFAFAEPRYRPFPSRRSAQLSQTPHLRLLIRSTCVGPSTHVACGRCL